MSTPNTVTLTCPDCGTRFKATIFDSVNTDFPGIPKEIITGELFQASCPNCDFSATMEYDVLYNDMNHMAMIWVVHEGKEDYEKRIEEISSMPYLARTTRIVSNMEELQEKVICLENGLDDRLIELYKYLLVEKLKEECPEISISHIALAYDGNCVCIKCSAEKGKSFNIPFENDTYHAISEEFGEELLSKKISKFQKIDRRWIIKYVNGEQD